VIRSTSRSVLAGLVVVGGVVLAGCAAGQIAQTAQQRPTVDGQEAQVGPIAIRYAALEYPDNGVYEQGSTARLRMVVVNTGDASDTLTSVRSTAASGVTIRQGTSAAATGSASAAPSAGSTGSASGSASGSATFSPSPTPGGTASGTPTGQAEPPESSLSAGSGAPSQSASGSAGASGSASPSGSASAGASPTPSAAESQANAQIPIPPNGYVSFTDDGPSVELTGLTQELRPAQNLSVTFTFQNAGSTTVTIAVATPEGQISLAPTVSVTPESESEG
jgi:copper(I)-binding protein